MFRLSVIVDHGSFPSDAEWLESLDQIAAAVADFEGAALQVRIKHQSPGEKLRLAGLAARVLSDRRARAFLNGTPGEAETLGFGAAHVPEQSIPSLTAVSPGGPSFGVSIHDRAALDRALSAGAAYVQFGPVFDAGSKPAPGVGLGALAGIAGASPVPVVAVGGIRPEDVADCFAAGARAVAVISGVLRAPDPRAAIAAYHAAVTAAACQRV